MDNGAYGRALYGLPEKIGLDDSIGQRLCCKVGVFLLGQLCVHNVAAVGRVVLLCYGVNLP